MQKKLQKIALLLSITFCLLSGDLSAQSTEDNRFEQVLQREWKQLMNFEPTLAVYLGEESENLWPNRAEEVRQARSQHYRELLTELGSFEATLLSEANQLNLQLFAEQLRWQIQYNQHGLDLFIMNQREGPQTLATLSSSIDFKTIDDYRKLTKRLQALPQHLRDEMAVLQESIDKNRVHPKVITQRMIEAMKKQPELHRLAEESPFFIRYQLAPKKFRDMPEFQQLKQQASTLIQTDIRQAYEEFVQFLEGPYLKASPEKVGLGQLPGGIEAYQFLIQRYTTTEMSAAEIHALGLSEVARIRKEMEKIKKEVGFEGSLEDFFQHLREDPKYYTKDPEELLRRYRSFAKQVDGEMPKFFHTLPRKPYGVKPIPDYIAPTTTTAYYLPGAGALAGTYYVNLYKPETRALFEIPALSMHEAVPGHHHQIALAQEGGELPAFRKGSAGFGDYTVFVEGWALYSESLGEEMGFYQDPYDRFGRYTYEMWRAIRLVLDTGIHTQGWSRERSIDYFLNNSPRSRLDVTNEVERYISWPGQALAYKIGELEIKKLRAEAEAALGEAFDIRLFHDAVLKEGAVPLKQVRAQVEDYIEKVRAEQLGSS